MEARREVSVCILLFILTVLFVTAFTPTVFADVRRQDDFRYEIDSQNTDDEETADNETEGPVYNTNSADEYHSEKTVVYITITQHLPDNLSEELIKSYREHGYTVTMTDEPYVGYIATKQQPYFL